MTKSRIRYNGMLNDMQKRDFQISQKKTFIKYTDFF